MKLLIIDKKVLQQVMCSLGDNIPQFARRIGTSRANVHNWVNGLGMSERFQRAIAEVIEKEGIEIANN